MRMTTRGPDDTALVGDNVLKRVVELQRNQERHDLAEHALEHGMVERIERIIRWIAERGPIPIGLFGRTLDWACRPPRGCRIFHRRTVTHYGSGNGRVPGTGSP